MAQFLNCSIAAINELNYTLENDWQLTVFKQDVPSRLNEKHVLIPLDYIYHKIKRHLLQQLIADKLKRNTSIFARNCVIQKITKAVAETFLNQYHLLGSTNAAFNYGIFHKGELIAVAIFSKGRKMNRLEAHLRSFELIRFACKSGISITGGLSKLLKHFCLEKNPGDIMTYIDKQFFNGAGFIKIGFKEVGSSEPNWFLITKNYERITAKQEDLSKLDLRAKEYITYNVGNNKLILTI
jgi:hypothetical protein